MKLVVLTVLSLFILTGCSSLSNGINREGETHHQRIKLLDRMSYPYGDRNLN